MNISLFNNNEGKNHIICHQSPAGTKGEGWHPTTGNHHHKKVVITQRGLSPPFECKIHWNFHKKKGSLLALFGHCGLCAHVFALCTRVRARIFTKIIVWVFYYHISLNFKFHTDQSFSCGDIFSDTRYFKVPIRQGVLNKHYFLPNIFWPKYLET